MQRVLFLCTGNSARSQMSEAVLRHLGGDDFEVVSAGTDISSSVNPFAVEVLSEREIPTEGLHPKKVSIFAEQKFDLVVTVCDSARQACPHFPGAKQMEHWPLEDPAAFEGTYDETLLVFRETRDEIERRVKELILRMVS
ncbi:MAG: arsenate reductase ArsC [Candidatus Thorarchaeota archaeon]|nr:MAG: arsenate reductase ArsC [Candidatus Thorarchaeota archaeon]